MLYSSVKMSVFHNFPWCTWWNSFSGNTDLLDIPIDAKTECCRLGSKSYLFYSPHEDLLVTFTSESGALFYQS